MSTMTLTAPTVDTATDSNPPVRGNPRTLSLLSKPSVGRRFVLGLLVWVGFFAFWLFGVKYSGIPAILMPAPQQVAAAAGNIIANEGFLWDVLASLERIFVSFLITSLVGIPLGILMGTFRALEATLNPFVSAWRYLPAAAFVPILLMWLGTGEGPKIALLFLGVIFFQITIMMDMTKAIPKPLLETAMTLGASRWQIVVHIILRWVLPNVVVALRQTIAIGWTYLVIAEIIASTDGIGAMMMRSQRFVHTDNIIVGIVAIGILGLLTDLAFQWLQRLLFPYLRLRS
jgi:NitT/TauT family transport system permease protein